MSYKDYRLQDITSYRNCITLLTICITLLSSFGSTVHVPLPPRREQQGHVGTSRGRHVHFSQRDRLPLT